MTPLKYAFLVLTLISGGMGLVPLAQTDPVAFALGAPIELGPQSLPEKAQCGSFGELRLFACVRGDGAPTIVLAAGAGQDSRTWDPVVADLATLGTVVTFDRPGFGRSPAVEGPRTSRVIATELRQLLGVLELSGPALVVGHSMGGIHALTYAELFPESVAGVLLLDAPPPGFEDARLALLSDREKELRREQLEDGYESARDAVRRERDGARAERGDFSGFPVDKPLIVAAADSQDFGELGNGEAHRRLWVEMSGRWLTLSRRSKLEIAAGSGHMIHQDRPELVLELVRELVALSGETRSP